MASASSTRQRSENVIFLVDILAGVFMDSLGQLMISEDVKQARLCTFPATNAM